MGALTTIALLATEAYKTYEGYRSNREAAKFADAQGQQEGALLDRNAGFADAQATDALARGEEAVGDITRQSRLLTGSQRAAFAAQGINLESGSPASVIASDRALSAQDMVTARNNARRAAWGFETQADSYRQQAGWARAGGANQARVYRQQATDTLLGGAGELANIWATTPHGVGSRPPAAGSGRGPGDYVRSAKGVSGTRYF